MDDIVQNNLVTAIMHRLAHGQYADEIGAYFYPAYTQEEIFLAFQSAKILLKYAVLEGS